MVALGLKVAGLFGNDEAFRKDLIAATRKTGERVWRMPMDDDFKEQLKSSVADLKNVGGKWGGAVTAAKFLEQFVGSTPWIHLDIAGPSWCDTENATRDAGGTGCFVRTLVALLERSAATAPRKAKPQARLLATCKPQAGDPAYNANCCGDRPSAPPPIGSPGGLGGGSARRCVVSGRLRNRRTLLHDGPSLCVCQGRRVFVSFARRTRLSI